MRDKFDIFLFIVTLLAGILIICFIPNGKDGYWIIPLIFYWIIRYVRKKTKDRKETGSNTP